MPQTDLVLPLGTMSARVGCRAETRKVPNVVGSIWNVSEPRSFAIRQPVVHTGVRAPLKKHGCQSAIAFIRSSILIVANLEKVSDTA